MQEGIPSSARHGVFAGSLQTKDGIKMPFLLFVHVERNNVNECFSSSQRIFSTAL